MLRAFKLFPVAMCFLGSVAYAADSQPTPAVQVLRGHLLDDRSGQLRSEDVFAPAFVPFNQISTPLLLMVTVDLGPLCVVREPSAEEARAIARGERPAPTRPATCEKPPGLLLAEVRYGDGGRERQTVALSRFFSGFDGKIHVPVLFYRRLPCQPIEVAVWTSAQKKPLVRRVEFRCAE